MNEDAMPTPCPSCDRIVDYRELVGDPLEEFDMICKTCRQRALQIKEELNE